MTREQAEDIAAVCYEAHPAAAPLILEGVHGATEERRFRSAQALRWLDPLEQGPPELPPEEDACLRALRWAMNGHRLKDRKRAGADFVRRLRRLVEAQS